MLPSNDPPAVRLRADVPRCRKGTFCCGTSSESACQAEQLPRFPWLSGSCAEKKSPVQNALDSNSNRDLQKWWMTKDSFKAYYKIACTED